MTCRLRVPSSLTLALCAFTWLSATPASSQPASPESPAQFQQACASRVTLSLLDTEGCGVMQDENAALDEERWRLHLLIALGAQFGGDTLVELRSSYGIESTHNAGDGLVFALGAMFEPIGDETHALQLQTSAGYSYAGVSASNGSASWTHWPVELLAFYNHRPFHFRVGGGLQYNFNVAFEGSGQLSAGTALFYSSPGAVLQGDWMFSQSFSLYARYTIIHYSVPGTSVDYSGNAFGMGLSWLPRLK